ncbi:hypothetical protein SULYE_0825 [Sulfurihydrogenibium yellowstonense SS-5]|uniref:Uncharacterized protein n=1 Tax=Sulfurihydrogenibium yellowstonense SS-5 TaxID=432331 RepID=C4FJS5_9AQUI|nr:hypothetical protein SULYE_0825 [Sulfurihydrogenibium yellowstonense SS-5]
MPNNANPSKYYFLTFSYNQESFNLLDFSHQSIIYLFIQLSNFHFLIYKKYKKYIDI